MSLLDAVKEKMVRPVPVPYGVDERLRRGRKAIREDAAKRRLCQIFLAGDQYAYINRNNSLATLATTLGTQSDKPTHRIRNRYNFIRPIVDAKVSSSTTRPPGYEVNPTGTDPEVVAGAHLSEKVLAMGYATWYLREARILAATLAIGGGGRAYGLPYFDPMVGPFIEDTDPITGASRSIGEGEIKCMVFSGNEVMHEPGVEFHHSRWYAAQSAHPVSVVEAWPGYLGGALSQDTSTSDDPAKDGPRDTVMVTMYFERPCPDYIEGRMLTIANGRQILPEGPYPMRHDNKAVDKPCLHQLMYRMDTEGEGDLGLTWELIDFQRTASDCYNKIIELKNRALNLQIMAPTGSLDKPPSDEPGAIIYYNPVGGQRPEWAKPPDPAIMQQLMSTLDRTLSDMRYVAADADLNAAPNVAAGALQTEAQQANNRWQTFLGDLARWDADMASHCLMLAQEHYTENRVLKVRGRYGWEPVQSFRGIDIMGQTDVHVNPATIESHSRAQILQQLGWIQANFPGYLRPEVAIDIVMTGTSPESVIESFEFDKARANLIIQHIRQGSVMDMPPVSMNVPGIDPLTGAPTTQQAVVPGWMPRPFDNVDIQLWVLETWMKSDDFTRLPPQMAEVAMLVYEGMKSLQADQAAQAAQAQAAQAEQLGATNASKPQPQDGKPMPSTPNPAGEGK